MKVFHTTEDYRYVFFSFISLIFLFFHHVCATLGLGSNLYFSSFQFLPRLIRLSTDGFSSSS